MSVIMICVGYFNYETKYCPENTVHIHGTGCLNHHFEIISPIVEIDQTFQIIYEVGKNLLSISLLIACITVFRVICFYRVYLVPV
jgi:hypothetical protein